MSLLGSEVDVPKGEQETEYSQSPERDDDDLDLTVYDMVTAYDAHPPVSPQRPAEALFLDHIPTDTISATLLAQQIHQTHRPLSIAGVTSIATDDFQSAAQDEQNLTLNVFIEDDSPFGKDAIAHQREPILEDNEFQETMSEEMHIDPAEKVYETAKNVWAWGKGVMLFRPFLGLAEGVAGKAVSVAGGSLEQVDGFVMEQLHGLDDKVLNPAIQAIVSTIMKAAGKSEDVLKPMIVGVMKPLGLIKDGSKTEPAPEVTAYGSKVGSVR